MFTPKLLFSAVVVFLASSGVNGAAYIPGCSFFAGQCLYTISQGQDANCLSAGSGSAAAVCCDTLKVDVKTIGSDNGKSRIVSLLGSKAQAQAATAQLEAERDDLLAELATVRSELADLTSQVVTCQASLGLSDGDSQPLTALGLPVNLRYCDFESDSDCTWTYDTDVVSHMTSSSSGPGADHSLGSTGGRFMALDVSKAAKNGKKYSTKTYFITSQEYEPANDYCIAFYYSMLGKDVQGLEVAIKTDTGSSYPVWSSSGPKSSDWLLAQFEVDREYVAEPFSLRFKVSTSSYKDYYGNLELDDGDIGIDDVYAYNGTCKEALGCSPNSVKRNSSDGSTPCYTFHVTALPWKDAYRTCREEGPASALVSVESEEEQNFLIGVINGDPALRVAGQSGFYTSGSDRQYEGSFKWTDTGSGRSVSGLYENWGYRQPNNVGGIQDCLLLEDAAEGFAWGDVDCDTAHPFICEKS
ncbi:hypothetical protein RRG08_029335 [Elysia crispata]|uniref:C-type lectin n=1 Tax=Elysia crispata TaxID=231223 RepID=A0AAE1ARR6_9GAST|nr:hypothetical protein RRG08_029335 [Elysia crispata]